MSRAPVRTVYGEVRQHIPTQVIEEQTAAIREKIGRLRGILPPTSKELLDELTDRVLGAYGQGSGKSPQHPDFIAARDELKAVGAEAQRLLDRNQSPPTEPSPETQRDDAFLKKSATEQVSELFGDLLSPTSPARLREQAKAIFIGFEACKTDKNLLRRETRMQELRQTAAAVKAGLQQHLQQQKTCETVESDVADCINLIKMNKGSSATIKAVEAQLAECKKGDNLDETLNQLRALKTRAIQTTQLVMACNSKLRTDPDNKKKILDALDKGPSDSELKALQQQLKTLEDAGKDRAGKRIKEVIGKSYDEIKALDPDQRVALIDDLRYADESTDTAKQMKHKALALVYLVTKEMQAEFKAKDDKMRETVLNELADNKVVLDLRKNWTLKTPQERSAGLNEMVKLQSAQMAKTLGIDPEKMPIPKIILTSDPDSGIPPDKLKNLAGGFSPTEGAIYIKDQKGGKLDTDCNYVLNTILHENTHNYQLKLVEMLEAGELDKNNEPGKALYEQARLFQLNMAPGPGYLGQPPGYLEQPTEVHAHLAGDTAEAFFNEQNLREAKAFLERMSQWEEEHSKNDKEIKRFRQAIEGGIASGKSGGIMDELNYYEQEFEKHCQAHAKKPVVTGDIEEAKKQLRQVLRDLNAIDQVGMDNKLIKLIQIWKGYTRTYLSEDETPEYFMVESHVEDGRKLIEQAKKQDT